MKAQSAEESLARIGRNRDEVLRQVDDLEKALNRDIIQALGLRYTHDAGLVSTEFAFDTDIFSGSINLLPTDPAADPVRFSPPFFEHGSVRIEPIDAFFTRWATLVVFRVGQMRSAGRLRLDWDAHEDGARNPIILVQFLIENLSPQNINNHGVGYSFFVSFIHCNRTGNMPNHRSYLSFQVPDTGFPCIIIYDLGYCLIGKLYIPCCKPMFFTLFW